MDIVVRDLDATSQGESKSASRKNEVFDVWSPRIIDEGAAAIARPGLRKNENSISEEVLRKEKVVYTGKRESLRLRAEGIPEKTDLGIWKLKELGRGAQGTVYRV